MKKLFYLFVVLSAIVGFSSCGNDDEKLEPSITLHTSDQVVNNSSSSIAISFETTTDWTATTSDNWCTITPSSGKAGANAIVANFVANSTYEDRKATITIASGNISKSLTICQKQSDAIVVKTSSIEVGEEGGETTIELNTNVDVSYSIDETAKNWISISATRSMVAKSIVLTIAKNESFNPREGKIYLKSGTLSETVTVFQKAGSPFIRVNEKEFVVASEGNSIKVEVESNIDYQIVMPSDKWISNTSNNGTSCQFMIDANKEYDNRSTTIIFKNDEYGKSETVNITQLQKDAIILSGSKEVEVDTEGGTFTIELKANVEYNISISDSWITETETRALVNYSHTYSVSAIPEGTEIRTATINITDAANSISETVTVKQEASIKLDKQNTKLLVGDSEQLNVRCGSTIGAVWTSSDAAVVSVDQSGTITAKKKGKATITITASNGKSSTCSVEVVSIEDCVSASMTNYGISIINGIYLNMRQYTITNNSPAEITVKSVESSSAGWWHQPTGGMFDFFVPSGYSSSSYSINQSLQSSNSKKIELYLQTSTYPSVKIKYTYKGKEYSVKAY